jgi:solute:Na+ symporter, SSS family
VVSLVAQGPLGLSAEAPRDFAILLMVTTAITTVVWLTVTYLTAPESPDVLRAFYARVRPGGPGWRSVSPDAGRDARIGGGLVQWAMGCVVVYLGLFGIGWLVLGRTGQGAAAVAVAIALTWVLVRATGADRDKSRVVS